MGFGPNVLLLLETETGSVVTLFSPFRGWRARQQIDQRYDSCPHHHQSKVFRDPDQFVKSHRQFLVKKFESWGVFHDDW